MPIDKSLVFRVMMCFFWCENICCKPIAGNKKVLVFKREEASCCCPIPTDLCRAGLFRYAGQDSAYEQDGLPVFRQIKFSCKAGIQSANLRKNHLTREAVICKIIR